MSTILTAFQIAKTALRRHLGRSILTITGIVVGITLVVLVISAGNAIRIFLIKEVSSFGSDLIEVEYRVPGVSPTSGAGIVVTTLKDSDRKAFLNIPNVVDGYSGIMGQAVVSHVGEAKKFSLFGTNASFLNVQGGSLAEGRFFTDAEEIGLARVAVLGAEVAERFFGEQSAIGEVIRIKDQTYRVIGVLEQLGGSTFFNWDDHVFLPLRTQQKLIDGIDHVLFMFFKMENNDRAPETRAAMEDLLRERHKIAEGDKDDFAVFTSEEMLDILGSVVTGIQILLIALASISLIVGGVGIMNIMYVSVSERTYEIGLRKAIGAKNRDILWQFLFEAIILTLIGGVVGIILGTVLSFVISLIAQAKGFDWQFVISVTSFVLAMGFSMAVGLIFGLYPARRASRLDPITALRYE